MKSVTLTLASVAFALAPICARGQEYGQPRIVAVAPPTYSSTAAEGALHGLADVVRADGERQLNSAQALVHREEARRRYIENRIAGTRAYFLLREVNRLAQYRERNFNPRSTVHVSHATTASLAPPLTLVRRGQIQWPALLRGEQFAAERQAIEALRAQIAATAEPSMSQDEALASLGRTMLTELKLQIRTASSQDYVTSVRFIKQLTLPNPVLAGAVLAKS